MLKDMPKKTKKQIKLVEIARSFSFKLNAGNFESRDFFCSEKMEVPRSQAIKTSEKLYAFCQDEVMKSVHNYQMENLPTTGIQTQGNKKIGRGDFIKAIKEAPESQAKQDEADAVGGEQKLEDENKIEPGIKVEDLPF